MDINKFAEIIVFGSNLEDKLLEIDQIDFSGPSREYEFPDYPGRDSKIKFSDKNVKFPRGHFHEKEKKAIALSSFANHELLAIEIMASVLLKFPHDTLEQQKFKRGVLQALKDEQKHFKMYVSRLNELGYEFGDFDLNDFFWKYMEKIKTPQEYLSTMALTFEAANLDFAHFYHHLFKELGDEKTANILKVVLDDEISHVNFGVSFLNKWKGEKTLWEYYNECLPYPLSPARSKGKFFIEEVRRKAKMDNDFIQKVKNFDDEFRVTKRKEWKK